MKKWNLIKPLLLLALGLILLISGCGNMVTTLDTSSNSELPFERGVSDVIAGPGYEMLMGVVGGAEFIFYIPAGWNGSLLLYAHGYVSPQTEELLIPEEFSDFSKPLMEMGFAVGCSSYSENGWAVKDGAIRTRQLLTIFTEHYTAPNRTYLAGASEGGIISLMLAEKNPELFDGVLSICGPVGGSKIQTEYMYHLRVLFRYFFESTGYIIPPLTEGSSVLDIPDGLDFEKEIAPLILMTLTTTPEAETKIALMSAVMTTLGFPIQPEELPETLLAALWYYYEGINDFFDRTHNHTMIDNQDTLYGISDNLLMTLPIPLQLYYSAYYLNMNEEIERVTSTPDAEKYMEHWYVPTGKLEIPVFMLHTSRDPAVPAVHQDIYKMLAVNTGSIDNLHQKIIEGFGHCMLTSDPSGMLFNMAVINSFTDLVKWVEYGIAP